MTIEVEELIKRINSEYRVMGQDHVEYYVKEDMDKLLSSISVSTDDEEILCKHLYSATTLPSVEIRGSFSALAKFLISKGWHL